MTLIWFLLGLVLLIVGAELLVRGASRLAAAIGISPLVIGLTVVAFGTSAPEFAVSIKSALDGQAGIAVGNVVGSNIFNVLFILGVSALLCPLVVSRQLIRLDVPLMIVASVLLLLFSLDAHLAKWEGAVFFGGLIAYTGFSVIQSRREKTQAPDEFAEAYGAQAGKAGGILLNLLLLVAGLALLILGSRWLVQSAVSIAQSLGVSELLIGLTIIAVGTSLPEVVTSIVAALKGERDIAVGNVVGSNLFNILGVLGLTVLVSPGGVPVAANAVAFDIPIMTAVAVVCLPLFFTGSLLARWEGGLLFAYYIAYTAYLVLAATGNRFSTMFAAGMIWFVIPLTAVTLGVLVVRAFRKKA